MTTFLKSFPKPGWVILIISFCVIVSLPILQAGFFSDDIINSLIPGAAALYQQSFWGAVVLGMKHWLSYGRLFPFSVISSVTIFYFFPVVADYQIIRVCFIWASIFSFAWFIKMLTKNTAAGLLFIFLMPLCWSMRSAPDPLTSFAIFLPLLVIFTAWTLIFYRYYQITQKQKFLVFSIISYTCALCTYEAGIVAFFLVLTLMYCKPASNRTQLTDSKYYLILLITYLTTSLALHFSNNVIYEGIQINLSARFWPTFFAQFTAPMPLSYYLFESHSTLSITELISNTHYGMTMIYLLLAGMVGIYVLLKQLVLTKRSCVCFIGMGLFLMVIPAFLMGINQKYQLILHWGTGYIPVYLQYIGMGLVLLAGFGLLNLSALSIKAKKSLHLVLAFLLSVVITLATLLNFATVNHINERFKFTRQLVEKAARHGFLEYLPDQSYLIEKMTLWNSPDFYMLNAHKPLAGVIDERDAYKLAVYDKIHHKYYLNSFHVPGSPYGYVVLGHAKWAELTTSKTNLKLTKAIFMTDPQLFIYVGPMFLRSQILQNLQRQLNLSPELTNKIALLYENNANDWLMVSLPAGVYRLTI